MRTSPQLFLASDQVATHLSRSNTRDPADLPTEARDIRAKRPRGPIKHSISGRALPRDMSPGTETKAPRPNARRDSMNRATVDSKPSRRTKGGAKGNRTSRGRRRSPRPHVLPINMRKVTKRETTHLMATTVKPPRRAPNPPANANLRLKEIMPVPLRDNGSRKVKSDTSTLMLPPPRRKEFPTSLKQPTMQRSRRRATQQGPRHGSGSGALSQRTNQPGGPQAVQVHIGSKHQRPNPRRRVPHSVGMFEETGKQHLREL